MQYVIKLPMRYTIIVSFIIDNNVFNRMNYSIFKMVPKFMIIKFVSIFLQLIFIFPS